MPATSSILEGPEGGLPKTLDRTGQQKGYHSGLQNIKAAIATREGGPDNLKHSGRTACLDWGLLVANAKMVDCRGLPSY